VDLYQRNSSVDNTIKGSKERAMFRDTMLYGNQTPVKQNLKHVKLNKFKDHHHFPTDHQLKMNHRSEKEFLQHYYAHIFDRIYIKNLFEIQTQLTSKQPPIVLNNLPEIKYVTTQGIFLSKLIIIFRPETGRK
jgi:hypothetical protein